MTVPAKPLVDLLDLELDKPGKQLVYRLSRDILACGNCNEKREKQTWKIERTWKAIEMVFVVVPLFVWDTVIYQIHCD